MKTIKNLYCKDKTLNDTLINYLALNNYSRSYVLSIGGAYSVSSAVAKKTKKERLIDFDDYLQDYTYAYFNGVDIFSIRDFYLSRMTEHQRSHIESIRKAKYEKEKLINNILNESRSIINQMALISSKIEVIDRDKDTYLKIYARLKEELSELEIKIKPLT